MPYRQVARARNRQALPAINISALRLLGAELRGALGDQRAALADEPAALLAHAHDHLSPLPERVRERALVRDGHGLGSGPVTYPEVRRGPFARVTRHDRSRERVDLPRGGGGEQLARSARLRRRGEARVDKRSGQQHGDAERYHEADLALAAGIHRLRLWRAGPP